MWLPGAIEVQVAGESFHQAAAAAEDSLAKEAGRARVLRGVLVPDPGNRHDPLAVAVYAAGHQVGFLPRSVARQVQPALVAFGQAGSSRRLVSCPAEIRYRDGDPQVVLLLDPAPLGLAPAAFEMVPGIAEATGALLLSLDEPQPVMTGAGQQATGYQESGGEDTLAALIKALQDRRDDVEAWSELVDLLSAAPHVPTLLALFARVPAGARPPVLAHLLQISHGRDRLGRLTSAAGERLRGGLLELAESQGDTATVATLAGLAGLTAEKAGDIGRAVDWWQRAVTAGSTDAKVADRFSIWLVKQQQHKDAVLVLRQALACEPASAALAERLRRRLARCERHVPGHTAAMRGQPAYQGRHRSAAGT